MPLSKEDINKLFDIFKIECEEHIQKLSDGLLSLEKQPDQPMLIEAIFREAHSMKGSARMINLPVSESIAHHIENILVKIKKQIINLSPEITNSILKGLGTISKIVKEISNGGKEEDVKYANTLKTLTQIEEGFCPIEDFFDNKIDNEELSFASVQGKSSYAHRVTKQPSLIEMDLHLFLEETNEAYRILVASLLLIEKKTDDKTALESAHTSLHALKGSARIIHHKDMGDLAFSMERILSNIILEKLFVSTLIVNTLFEGTDIIKHFIELIETGKEKSLPANYFFVTSRIDSLLLNAETDYIYNSNDEKKQFSPIETDRSFISKSTVRISSEKLDKLMEQAGELLTMKLKAQQQLATIQSILDECHFFLNESKKKKKITSYSFVNKPIVPNSQSRDAVIMVAERLESLYKEWFNDCRYFNHVIDELQYDIKKTRLLSLRIITDLFPRMVRDIASSLGKKITFEIVGADLEFDKYILEEIKAPLMHILRNSIDHGIEIPAVRKKMGKHEEGYIKIVVANKGNNAEILISDDGSGIDLDAIRSMAVKKGLFTENEISKLSKKQIINLIFDPGFSTSKIITDISGRGIGLDVVKSNIEKLNGNIDINTTFRKGTTIILTIPLTFSTIQALRCIVNNRIFFLPINMVEKIVKISEKELSSVEGFPSFEFNGVSIPYSRLSSILELPESENDLFIRRPAAVLRSGDTLAALGIDKFLGEEEILIKGLGPFIKKVNNVSGITIMSDGRIAPILNISDLINNIQIRGNFPKKIMEIKEAQDKADLPLLVVDDSVMTRTLEKNILESYGFTVITAVDGHDALIKLSEYKFSIVITDIQMPNMDGMELTRKIKDDPRYKQLPVILLTAMESMEDKKKGLDAGADAYIIKSSFDHLNLLETVKRLI